MTSITIDESQRKAAKVVGFAYLFAMATSIFAEGYVRGTLIVADNAAPEGKRLSTRREVLSKGSGSFAREMERV